MDRKFNPTHLTLSAKPKIRVDIFFSGLDIHKALIHLDRVRHEPFRLFYR